jgi:hypothetical protein
MVDDQLVEELAARYNIEPEWVEWYLMSPTERWNESMKLWQHYLEVGGSRDPEPDSQSPFFDPDEPYAVPVDGRPGVLVTRRSGVLW